jgi:hypothetical protein
MKQFNIVKTISIAIYNFGLESSGSGQNNGGLQIKLKRVI